MNRARAVPLSPHQQWTTCDSMLWPKIHLTESIDEFNFYSLFSVRAAYAICERAAILVHGVALCVDGNGRLCLIPFVFFIVINTAIFLWDDDLMIMFGFGESIRSCFSLSLLISYIWEHYCMSLGNVLDEFECFYQILLKCIYKVESSMISFWRKPEHWEYKEERSGEKARTHKSTR